MRNLIAVTITGIDSSTSLAEVLRLSRLYPWVEWGILYSPDRAGGGRYMHLDEILRWVNELRAAGVQRSLHLCGRAVDRYINGAMLPSYGGVVLSDALSRLQLNSNQERKQYDIEDIARAVAECGFPVITQHNSNNASVVRDLPTWQHHVLYDASGGEGVDDWSGWLPAFDHKIATGYSGGIGPDNISDALMAAYACASGKPFWIDMEGKLRNESDELDLDRVEAVLHAVSESL